METTIREHSEGEEMPQMAQLLERTTHEGGENSGYVSNSMPSGTSYNTVSQSSHFRFSALFVLAERSIHEYNVLIGFSLALDIASIMVQSYILTVPEDFVEFGLCIAGVVVTSWACINYIMLLWQPRKDICVCGLFSAFAIEVVYAAQIIYYYVALYQDTSAENTSYGAIIVLVWFVLQFLPLIMLYRFWEYLMYNYDYSSRGLSTSSAGSPRRKDDLTEALFEKSHESLVSRDSAI